MLSDYVKEHNPKDVLDINNFLAIREEILAELNRCDKLTPLWNGTQV